MSSAIVCVNVCVYVCVCVGGVCIYARTASSLYTYAVEPSSSCLLQNISSQYSAASQSTRENPFSASKHLKSVSNGCAKAVYMSSDV
jgi:hypothetical protein